MPFIADKQTLDDLNIAGKYRPDSVFNLFNKVVTRGGEKLLELMFREPLVDHLKINERANAFKYFMDHHKAFPFTGERFGAVENYLGNGSGGSLIASLASVAWKKVLALTVRDREYGELHDQLVAAIDVLNGYLDFLNKMDISGLREGNFNGGSRDGGAGQESGETSNPYLAVFVRIRALLKEKNFGWLRGSRGISKLSLLKMARYDHQLRSVQSNEIREVLESIYKLDVFAAVSGVALQKGFLLPRALPESEDVFSAVNLRHPCLEKAVGNPLLFQQHSNVLFLTGANMAGKSTFMKSFGVAIYLAHMGFPVTARDLVFSVKEGLFSSINVPDNLNQGYSHFYAEVLRVKKVAEEIARGKNLFVIFDELFKGTNVKDAYDATLEVTAAFSEHRNCFFIISTHITEAGDELRKTHDNMQFLYFPSFMDRSNPVYTYKLQAGISSDRHGMAIIENEGILELITGSPEMN